MPFLARPMIKPAKEVTEEKWLFGICRGIPPDVGRN
jgi:hypothetical protein